MIQIELWTWRLDGALSSSQAALLSDDEKARAARFKTIQLCERWTAARAGLRIVLARHLGVSPSSLQFEIADHGKPALMGGPHFNLSHSDGFAALAVCASEPVGVDIERLGELHQDVAEQFFAPEELAALAATPLSHRAGAFYRCWTAKEAFLKALGVGFEQPIESVIVDFLRAKLIRADWVVGGVDSWRLLPFICGDGGYVGTIAVQTSVGQVMVQDRSLSAHLQVLR
jgi:4'-phosphopantetheinyl transferase